MLKKSSQLVLLVTGFLFLFFLISHLAEAFLYFLIKIFLLSRTWKENSDKYRSVLSKVLDCSYHRYRFLGILHHQTATDPFRGFMFLLVLTAKLDLLISQIYDLMLQGFEALWELQEPSSYSLLF